MRELSSHLTISPGIRVFLLMYGLRCMAPKFYPKPLSRGAARTPKGYLAENPRGDVLGVWFSESLPERQCGNF